MLTDSWTRLTEGDQDAFLAVYQSNYQALFCYGFSLSSNRELTKDCIHDMFLEIWGGRAGLNKEIKNLRSYLFTWLRRKMFRELGRIAKEKRQHEGEGESEIFQASYEELLIAFQQTEENKELLRNALKKLSKKQLEIIRLKFFENLSYREIAIQTSLTPRTVYNLIYESVRTLRQALKLVILSMII
jgi:RNA polymerase sigma factor (sigma-70 family)